MLNMIRRYIVPKAYYDLSNMYLVSLTSNRELVNRVSSANKTEYYLTPQILTVSIVSVRLYCVGNDLEYRFGSCTLTGSEI